MRRRVHAGLNKGEARNALARAVFFHRLGEIRDRSFAHLFREDCLSRHIAQTYRAVAEVQTVSCIK